ncbi:uncharacterized protein V6R79_007638 [Siganus canaliculatus]
MQESATQARHTDILEAEFSIVAVCRMCCCLLCSYGRGSSVVIVGSFGCDVLQIERAEELLHTTAVAQP